jgi:hypothetical protein
MTQDADLRRLLADAVSDVGPGRGTAERVLAAQPDRRRWLPAVAAGLAACAALAVGAAAVFGPDGSGAGVERLLPATPVPSSTGTPPEPPPACLGTGVVCLDPEPGGTGVAAVLPAGWTLRTRVATPDPQTTPGTAPVDPAVTVVTRTYGTGAPTDGTIVVTVRSGAVRPFELPKTGKFSQTVDRDVRPGQTVVVGRGGAVPAGAFYAWDVRQGLQVSVSFDGTTLSLAQERAVVAGVRAEATPDARASSPAQDEPR